MARKLIFSVLFVFFAAFPFSCGNEQSISPTVLNETTENEGILSALDPEAALTRSLEDLALPDLEVFLFGSDDDGITLLSGTLTTCGNNTVDLPSLPTCPSSTVTEVRTLAEYNAWQANPVTPVRIKASINFNGQNIDVATGCIFATDIDITLSGLSDVAINARQIDLGAAIQATGHVSFNCTESILIRQYAGMSGPVASYSLEAPSVDDGGDASFTGRYCADGNSVIIRQASRNGTNGGDLVVTGLNVDIHGDFLGLSTATLIARYDLIVREAAVINTSGDFVAHAQHDLDYHGDITVQGNIDLQATTGLAIIRDAAEIDGNLGFTLTAATMADIGGDADIHSSRGISIYSGDDIILRQASLLTAANGVRIACVDDLDHHSDIHAGGSISLSSKTMIYRQAAYMQAGNQIHMAVTGTSSVDFYGTIANTPGGVFIAVPKIYMRDASKIRDNGPVQITVTGLFEDRGDINYNGPVCVGPSTFKLYSAHRFTGNESCIIGGTKTGTVNPNVCTEGTAVCTAACSPDLIYENGACIGVKEVDCIPAGAIPAHSHYSNEQVIITYTTADGWSLPANCAWECDTDYTTEDDATCIHEKQVDCNAENDNPANSHDSIVPVTVIYTTAGDWETPALCAWTCDEGYREDNGQCEPDEPDPCNGVTCSDHGTCEVVVGSGTPSEITIGTTENDQLVGGAVLADGSVVIIGNTAGTFTGNNSGVVHIYGGLYTPQLENVWFVEGGDEEYNSPVTAMSVTPEGILTFAVSKQRPDYPEQRINVFDIHGLFTMAEIDLPFLDQVRAITMRDDDIIVIAGMTGANLFGTNAGGTDIFVAAYTTEGTLLWGKQFGTSGMDQVQRIEHHSDGSLYLAAMIPGAGDPQDAVVVKLQSNGDLAWFRPYGTTAADQFNRLMVDDDGSVLLTGTTMGSLFATNNGLTDIIAVKLNASGDTLWSKQFGTDARDGSAGGVKKGPDGFYYLAGFSHGDFDGIPNEGVRPDGQKTADLFIVRMDTTTGDSLRSWVYGFVDDERFPIGMDFGSDPTAYLFGHEPEAVGGKDMDNFLLAYPLGEEGYYASCLCETDYANDGDPVQCIHEKQVNCRDVAPQNATSTIVPVTIYYYSASGWSQAAACEWSCNADHVYEEGSCINQKQVDCDIDNGNPEHSQDIIVPVMVTYTDAGGWSVPALCAWACESLFEREGDICVPKECYSGATDTIPCGLNNRGVMDRLCVEWQWVESGICDDPDECLDGAAEDRACGFNGRGEGNYICIDGIWQENYCDDPDVCGDGWIDGISCGLNGRGYGEKECIEGQWYEISCNDPDVCIDYEADFRSCGLNGNGSEERYCYDGQWQEWSECYDPDECVNGATEEMPCGLNGRGIETRVCLAGQWGTGVCVDPDECVDDQTKVQSCGLNDRGEQISLCVLGHWSDWSACGDTDVCLDGATDQRSCGLNDRGTQLRTCVMGQWSEWALCSDPDECVDNASENRACGINGRGVETRICINGQWGAWSVCNDPDECLDDETEERTCGFNGRGTELRTCVEGQWSAWGQCVDPDECVDDTTQECSTICESGIQSCVAGHWGACSARQPSPEICDGIDNDCNGEIDELEECLCYLQDCGGHGYCIVNNWVASCLCETDYTTDIDPLFCIHEKQVNCETDNGNPEHSHDIMVTETVTYTSATGWSTPSVCAWVCDTDYISEDNATCIHEKQVLCDTNNGNPLNSEDSIVPVTITYSSSSGWSQPAVCAWECLPDHDYTYGGCYHELLVACDTNNNNPPNSTEQVVGVTITYTDAGGWSAPALCAWSCNVGYVLENGACLNEKTVNCNANNGNPVNSHDIVTQHTVYYIPGSGWSLPPLCAWECDPDHALENGACIHEKQVNCDTGNDNPAYSHDLIVPVTITYSDATGWTQPVLCAWACDTNYALENGQCLHEKQVDCDTENENPLNSEDILVPVTIFYSSATGWSQPADCAWQCVTDHTPENGACTHEKQVNCDTGNANPEYSHDLVEPVTITYTDAGGWSVPALCAWACDPLFERAGDICVPEECYSGATDTIPCGLNNRGVMDRLCVEWQWVESGICVDPDVCVDDAQEFSLCGLNGRGESSRTCVLGQWSAWGDCNDPDECLDDDSRGCLNVCHPGHEYCVEGQWAPCDAPAPHPEICDGIDNDCNGQTDELEECLCYLQDCGGHGLCVVNNWVAACLCETDYTIDGDPLICIHEKPAPCSPNTDLIPHARDIVIDVTITFSSQDGWNTADTCDWECEPAYLLKNGACVDKCTDIDCSGHGACNAESGTATCECEEGYTPYGTECAENLPPFIPEAPYPENDAYDIPYGSRVLTWLGGDPDGDVVTYTVIIDTVLPPRKIACAAAAVESCTVSLQSGTRYFWQVTATDAGGKTVDGPLWRFKTAIDQGNPAPAWPSGSVLYAARTGSAALELRWTQAQDSGGIREYVLYNGGEPFAKIQPGQAPTVSESGQTRHSFVLMPLDPETPYDLKIEACDGNLCTNNGPSAVVTTIPMENTVKQEELLDRSAFLALIDLARAIYRPTATTEPVQHFTKADPGNDDAPMYREQVALLSGEVMDETGMPMSDVLVYVKDHPEYGYTYTRAGDDAGKWDLVVNGGPTYILVFYRSGYLSVQRAVTTTGNMSNTITRVVLIEEAAPAGTLDLTSPEPQFVEGVSHNDDGRGERRGVIVLTPGTEALAVQADGTIVPLETLTIRQSEYTRTENGREAMPAPLPRGIRYTYCAEFSVDEAPDAKAIFFSKPLYYYLDNFLDLPVGTGIPNGVFDRERSEWVGEFDAIVLSLLSVSERIDGTLLAEIDMDGDGLAESAATLYAQLGVTDAEREIIAAKYGPTLSGGAPKTFWRAPMTRFSPRDINLFAGIPSGSIGPVAKADTDETDPNEMDCPSSSTGSSIECESRILGEQLTIPGTPFSLHYRSDHSGRLANRSIMGELLNLVEYLAKDDIAGILIEIQTASAGTYYASRNGSDFTWTWSGKGQNGLPLTGEQRARVTVKYFYRAKYSCPGYTTRGIGFRSVEEARTTLLYGVGSSSGGGDGDSSILGSDVVVCGDAGIQSLDQVFYVKLHNRATNPQGMGGLTLDVNARYDHDSKRLYRGDGLVRQAEYLDQVITTTKGGLSSPEFIRLLPDGSVVFSETIQGTDYKNRIRKLAPNGELTTIAGGGTQLYRDGMAPLDAALYIKSMDTDDKGRIYFADNTRRQVLKIDLDGLLYLVAGSGISCGAPLYLCSGLAGENGPAVNAALVDLEGLAVAPDGALYFGANSSVRKVGTDGVIHSLFSNLRPLPNQYIPNLLRVTKDNTHLLVSGTNCSYYSCRGDLSKINLQGSPTITSLVGGNEQTYFPDLVPEGYGPDIRFYFNYVTAGALSYIMYYQNGTYTAVSGGAIGYSGDNGLARYAQYQYPLHLTINDNGETYVADRTNSVIRKIGSPNASVPAGGYMIADRQTGDILVFDRYGRHLRTLDPVTGVERYRFEYTQSPIADPNYPTGAYVGLTLSKVIDTDGRETLVDRSDPDEVRIISPDGQLSIVELNGQGFASRLIQPDGSSYVFDYTSLREEALLLSKITYPNGRWTEYLYDGDGRLKKVIDQRTTEAAPFKQLISLPTTGKKEMKTWLYTAEKKSLYYRYDNAAGIVTREQTAPDGTVDSSLNTLALAQTTASRNGGDITMTAYETKDQRFGWQMPYVSSQSITTDGLTMTVSRSKTAVLANPVDLFSHTALTDTTTVNGKTWQSTFTKADMKYRATSPLGRISDTFVNAKGRVTLQQGPQIAGTATEPVGYTWATDGKLTAIMQGSGASERRMDITYYPVTDLSSGALKGEIATIVDPLDRTVDFEYDTMGRVTRQIFEKGTADERDILYTYDASGNVLSIAPAGRPEHDFHYNLVDLPDRYSAPQVPGVSPDAVHSHYNYNRDRQLESIVRPDGTTIGMIYDIYKEYEDPGRTYSGKLMKIAVPGRGDIALTYETTGGKKLDSITTPEGNALNYTYTGALLASESWSGAVSGTVSRTYNNDFRVTALTVNGVSAAYTYDNDGLLTGAGDLVVTRDPQSGLVTGTTLGAVTTTQSYNSFGELVAFNADDYAYTLTQRDKLGRITEKTETVEGTTTTYGYEYDAAGRLAKVWENDILQSEYGYDDNGNRLVKNGVSATYDDQDRMLSNGGVVYTYSVNGDLETKTDTLGTTIYDYDALGNLNAVVLPDKTVNYVYDGRNRRIAKSVDGVVTERFIYFGQLRPAAKMNGDGTVAETYIYGTKANVPEYVLRNGNRYRVVTDHLGSVRMVVDVADGTVKQRMQYDEFGIVTEDYSETGFEPLPFGFAGGLYDRDTQLVTFGVREYDPETGRWLEKEPLGFAGAYNFYAYTSSDPVNYTDRNGYWKGSGHEDLTERALDYWGFDFYDIKIVIAANVQTDDLKNLKKGAYHYDPGYEKEAKARLDDLFQKAVDLENRGCHNEAMQVLGSFLHTAQDYYAHSLPNYDFWDHLDPTTAADDPVRLKPLYDAAYLDTIKRVGEFLKRTK